MSIRLAQLDRLATEIVVNRQKAVRLPKVIWAGLMEEPARFELRCAQLRKNGAKRILAVIPFGYPTPDWVQPVPFSEKLFELLHPTRATRYRVATGGRGSGKSHGFATALILRMLEGRIRVLCAREIQQSLRESVHHLLDEKISHPKLGLRLTEFFNVQERAIKCSATGSEVIFAGLYQNASGLRSLEDISICWIEESESVSADSLEVLIPTIRGKDSEIWMTANPDSPEAPVMSFANGERPNTLHTHVIFKDNRWFGEPLESERSYLESVDVDAYSHVWLGNTRTVSDVQVFAGKYRIAEFEPDLEKHEDRDWRLDKLASLGRNSEAMALRRKLNENFWQGPYFGMDFGYIDPTVVIRLWIYQRKLWIEYEAWQVRCGLDKYPDLLDRVPGARDHVIRADNARPESIKYLQTNGFARIESVQKWPNSVEEGVSFMRQFEEIIVHPRCAKTAEELRLFSHKKDRLNGDPLPEFAPGFDHCIDSIRYALNPMIKAHRPATVTGLWEGLAALGWRRG